MAPRRKRNKSQKPKFAPGPTTYRPALSHNILVMVAMAVFGLIGVGCFIQGDRHTQFLGYPLSLMAVFLLLVGTARFFTRVVVTAEGMTRSPWFPNGFQFAWADVEAWAVLRIQSRRMDRPDSIGAQFALRGGKRAIHIADQDVSQPGFGEFLRDIRRFVGGRER